MYTKSDLEKSLANEFRIIKHLFTKIPDGAMLYKPTEGQRTTLELLQYLSMVGPATLAAIKAGDTSVFMPYVESAKSVTGENFLERFEASEAETMKTLSELTEAMLAEKIDMFRMGEMTKGVYLVETILKWLAAYKMQLFLYAKAAGNSSIGTSNLWGGFDMEPA